MPDPIYARRDTEALGNLYIRHLEAMTAEGLHEKSAIAAELAWRDAEIAELEAERDEYRRRAFKAELEGGWRVEPSAYVEREKYDALRKAVDWLAHNAPGAPVPEWVDDEVTVRRADKPTPHVLRKQAEAERDALRALLREADLYLTRHHESTIMRDEFDSCPVCNTPGDYPNNIFGRIERALAAGPRATGEGEK